MSVSLNRANKLRKVSSLVIHQCTYLSAKNLCQYLIELIELIELFDWQFLYGGKAQPDVIDLLVCVNSDSRLN